jgi:hypothetical protein
MAETETVYVLILSSKEEHKYLRRDSRGEVECLVVDSTWTDADIEAELERTDYDQIWVAEDVPETQLQTICRSCYTMCLLVLPEQLHARFPTMHEVIAYGDVNALTILSKTVLKADDCTLGVRRSLTKQVLATLKLAGASKKEPTAGEPAKEADPALKTVPSDRPCRSVVAPPAGQKPCGCLVPICVSSCARRVLKIECEGELKSFHPDDDPYFCVTQEVYSQLIGPGGHQGWRAVIRNAPFQRTVGCGFIHVDAVPLEP